MKFDYLIVGAGLAGTTMARLLVEKADNKVLIVDYRNHIGGNIYDCYNDNGILIHKYGAHLFHTKVKKVWDFLSRFTDWHIYNHKVLAFIDGKKVPIPINVDTINQLYGTIFTALNIQNFFEDQKVQLKEIRNSEDQIISQVGKDLYEKFFKNYTKKQWGLEPSELDKAVTARIPVRTNRDDRYFSDPYQGIPKLGYTKMVQNMLDHPNIKFMLNTSYEEVKDIIPHNKLIYTGPIDRFFDYKYGKLPYRSLKFEHLTLNQEYFQEVMVINYPNDYDFTRILEFKHCTGQIHHKTTICKEYPSVEGEAYYPIPTTQNHNLYNKYKEEADKLKNIYFIGRLAEYKYFDMDMVVNRAILKFKEIENIKK